MGYILFRQDRIKGVKERGGGVLLYVRESLGAVREERESNDISESLWVKMSDSLKREFYIGVCYRSPNASNEEIDSLYTSISKYSKFSSLIMGDLIIGILTGKIWIREEKGVNLLS